MINHDDLTNVIHALLIDHPGRAEHLIATTDRLEDHERSALFGAITGTGSLGERLQLFGEALTRLGAPRDMVNETYRAAFYGSDHWQDLTDDPLYSYFVANRAGLLVDKWVHYFPIYTRHLSRYRGTSPRVLEIGVYRGGSMGMWTRFFGEGVHLVGLDIDPVAIAAAKGRYSVALGDQSDPEQLRRIAEEHGPFDVVIDDGGHTMDQQIVSAETLFPYVTDGGAYLVEDCHTSYWDSYGGGRGREGTFMEWVKTRLDDIHGFHLEGDGVDPLWTKQVDGIHVYDSVVILDKKRRFAPFAEQVGGAQFVWRSRDTSAAMAEIVAISQATRDELAGVRTRAEEVQEQLDQLRHAVGDAETPTGATTSADGPQSDAAALAEQLRQARGELQSLLPELAALQQSLAEKEATVGELESKLHGAWELLRQVRGSSSWRMTRPLRAVRSRWQ